MSLITTDAHSDAATAALAGTSRPIAVSDFLSAEVFAVLTKRLRTGRLNPATFAIAAAAYDDLLRDGAINHALHPGDGVKAIDFVRRVDLKLRAPDALHLAICRRLGATLLTFDDDQATAARVLGIALA